MTASLRQRRRILGVTHDLDYELVRQTGDGLPGKLAQPLSTHTWLAQSEDTTRTAPPATSISLVPSSLVTVTLTS